MRFPAEENSLVYTVEKASSAGLLMTAASLRHSNADNISKKHKKRDLFIFSFSVLNAKAYFGGQNSTMGYHVTERCL